MKLELVLQTKGDGVETIRPDATVGELAKRLTEMKIGALVVSFDGRNVAGIVSERDIVKNIARYGADVLNEQVSTIIRGLGRDRHARRVA